MRNTSHGNVSPMKLPERRERAHKLGRRSKHSRHRQMQKMAQGGKECFARDSSCSVLQLTVLKLSRETRDIRLVTEQRSWTQRRVARSVC